jgi:CheY-like chemotaxis protein
MTERYDTCVKNRNISSPRILVVEDNPDARELIVLVLARLGYEITEARNGPEALDKAIAENPELIFLDLGLPV